MSEIDSMLAWAICGNKRHHLLCEMQPWGAGMFPGMEFCDCGAEPEKSEGWQSRGRGQSASFWLGRDAD